MCDCQTVLIGKTVKIMLNGVNIIDDDDDDDDAYVCFVVLIAITQNKTITCVGDINRQHGQFKRGGKEHRQMTRWWKQTDCVFHCRRHILHQRCQSVQCIQNTHHRVQSHVSWQSSVALTNKTCVVSTFILFGCTICLRYGTHTHWRIAFAIQIHRHHVTTPTTKTNKN